MAEETHIQMMEQDGAITIDWSAIAQRTIRRYTDEALRRAAAMTELAFIKGWKPETLKREFIKWWQRFPLGFWDAMGACKRLAAMDKALPWEDGDDDTVSGEAVMFDLSRKIARENMEDICAEYGNG